MQVQDELKALAAMGVPVAGPMMGAVAGGLLVRLVLGPQVSFLGAIVGAVIGSQVERDRQRAG
jgi:uncharacterized protein YcfJ